MAKTALFAFFFALPFLISAQTIPEVSSFSASPSSIGNGQTVVLSWTLSNAGGYGLEITCADNVKVRFAESGNAVACGSRLTPTVNVNDSILFIVTNTSGSLKTVTATLYPKDGTGAYQDSRKRSIALTVGPHPEPITEVTGTGSALSGSPSTVSWKSTDLDYVNLIFDCREGLRISSADSGSGFLPCSQNALSSNLPANGSYTFIPHLGGAIDTTYGLLIVPVIGTSLYDASHGKRFEFTVKPAPVLTPRIISAAASPTTIPSGSAVNISWTAADADFVRAQTVCLGAPPDVTITLLEATSSPSWPCGSSLMKDFGTTTGAKLSIANKTGNYQLVRIILSPGKADGTYYTVYGKTLDIVVLPPGVALPPSSTGTAVSAAKIKFTRNLARGARNAEVEELQRILLRDKAASQGVFVSGFFGPATEKALMKLQEKNNIARPGVPGYGTVGPKTRQLLNSL